MRWQSLIVASLTPLLLSSCRGQYGANSTTGLGPNASPASSTVDGSGQQDVIAAQTAQSQKVEITVSARVYKLLPDDNQGLPHQRFLLRLNNGTTVLVAHDTRLAPHVPLSEGDLVCIHGEYIWNNRGGVIHWTHRCLNGHHDGGWIDFKGQRYQ